MKKIIELFSLATIMFAVIMIDVNVYRMSSKRISDRYYALENKVIRAEADNNRITMLSFDDYVMNKINIEEEIKEQEHQAYLAYLESLIVYDGLTMEELASKLNRSLKNELSGYGELYASYSLEKGVDPYMAVAISLHETGCNGNCSGLMKSCNNVGGQKGTPNCGSGSYKLYSTLEDGIKGYIDNLAKNYFAVGLNTPELMARKYAASDTWASKVNYYIDKIKAA